MGFSEKDNFQPFVPHRGGPHRSPWWGGHERSLAEREGPRRSQGREHLPGKSLGHQLLLGTFTSRCCLGLGAERVGGGGVSGGERAIVGGCWRRKRRLLGTGAPDWASRLFREVGVFALLTQGWAFPASLLGGKGRASGHQATGLLPVLRKRIPDWVGGCDSEGMLTGTVPARTWDWPEGDQEGCKQDRLNFL